MKIVTTLPFLLAFSIISIAVLAFFSVHPIYNADAIQIPMFAHWFIYKQLSISDWYFPPVNYLFPDLAVITLLSVFISKPLVVIWLYAVLQMLAFCLIVAFLIRTAINDKSSWRFALIPGLIALLMVAKGHLNYEVLQQIVVSNYHLGNLLMLCLALALSIRLHQKKAKAITCLLFLVILLGSFSDVLFVFYYSMPMLLVLTLLKLKLGIERGDFLRFLLVIIISTVIGALLTKLLPSNFPSAKLHFHWWLVPRIVYLYHDLAAFFFREPIIAFLWVAYMAISGYQLFASIGLKVKDESLFFLHVFIWIMVVFSLIGLLIVDNSLGIKGFVGLRHMQPLILLPVFVGFPLLLWQAIPGIKVVNHLISYLLILTVLSVLALWRMPVLQIHTLLHYKPKGLTCLEQKVKQLGLHVGIAGYWTAKPYMFFSQGKIKLAQVDRGANPYIWIGPTIFYHAKHIDYAIIYNPYSQGLVNKPIQLKKRYGQPTSTFSCGGVLVAVYQKGMLIN